MLANIFIIKINFTVRVFQRIFVIFDKNQFFVFMVCGGEGGFPIPPPLGSVKFLENVKKFWGQQDHLFKIWNSRKYSKHIYKVYFVYYDE